LVKFYWKNTKFCQTAGLVYF